MMNPFYKLIFTKEAQENIAKTENVWGNSIEYDFKFSVKIWRRVIFFEQRSAKQAWGRFGGGWSFKLGVQSGSFKSFLLLKGVIFSLFTMTIHIRTAK